MVDITAIIVAAGLGMRMGPRGTLMPKGLIEVGGAGLVPQSVATLQRWGAARIVIVTGHLQEQYVAAFQGSGVSLVHNDKYETTGSLQTLLTALAVTEGPVMILESDLIYAPQVLDAVDPTYNRFMVSGPTGAGDEVYCWVKPDAAGSPMDVISKDPNARAVPPFGEMIGITCLTADAAARLAVAAERVLASDPAAHYEEGLVALAQEIAIECVLFPDIAWAEMDDEEMLARVKADVWPEIEAARLEKWGTPLEV